MAIHVTAPLTREDARKLRSGDSCLISGVIYTARDAAHKRLCELVAQGKIQLRPLMSKHFAFRDYLEAYHYIDANRETSMKILIDIME